MQKHWDKRIIPEQVGKLSVKNWSEWWSKHANTNKGQNTSIRKIMYINVQLYWACRYKIELKHLGGALEAWNRHNQGLRSSGTWHTHVVLTPNLTPRDPFEFIMHVVCPRTGCPSETSHSGSQTEIETIETYYVCCGRWIQSSPLMECHCPPNPPERKQLWWRLTWLTGGGGFQATFGSRRQEDLSMISPLGLLLFWARSPKERLLIVI